MEIKVFEKFLDDTQSSYVSNRTLMSNGWKFSGKSNHDEECSFWYLDLNEDPFFTSYMLYLIQAKTNNKYKIDRVYANGQTFGMPGSVHTDVEPEKYGSFFTFLYYLNIPWEPIWAGQTLFFKENNLLHTQPYSPNCGVLFDSKIPHVGMDPSRHCKKLRVTVAFKLVKLDN